MYVYYFVTCVVLDVVMIPGPSGNGTRKLSSSTRPADWCQKSRMIRRRKKGAIDFHGVFTANGHGFVLASSLSLLRCFVIASIRLRGPWSGDPGRGEGARAVPFPQDSGHEEHKYKSSIQKVLGNWVMLEKQWYFGLRKRKCHWDCAKIWKTDNMFSKLSWPWLTLNLDRSNFVLYRQIGLVDCVGWENIRKV